MTKLTANLLTETSKRKRSGSLEAEYDFPQERRPALLPTRRRKTVSSSIETELQSYQTKIRDHLINGQLNASRDLLNRLAGIDKRSTAQCFYMLIVEYTARKQYKQAVSLLDEMKDLRIEITEDCISAALKACGKDGLWEAATDLILQMQANGKKLRHPDYACAMHAVAKAGQTHLALDMLKDMPQLSLRPSVVNYNAAINACSKGHQPDMALDLLRSMLQEEDNNNSLQTEDGYRRRNAQLPVPNVCTYNTAMDAMSRSKQWEKALELLGDMGKKGLSPDIYSYNTIISACGRAGHWQKSVDYLQGLRRQGESLRPNAWSFNTAISACARASQWQQALDLLSCMHADRVRPNGITYTAVLTALCSGRSASSAADNTAAGAAAAVGGGSSDSSAVPYLSPQHAGDVALQLLQELLYEANLLPDALVWKCVLGACAASAQHTAQLPHVLYDLTRSAGVSLLVCETAHCWCIAYLCREVRNCKYIAPNADSFCNDARADALYVQLQCARLKNHWSLNHPGLLDLHNFSAGAACAAVRLVLRDAIANHDSTGSAGGYVHDSRQPLYVITGHGERRAPYGLSILQPTLLGMLTEKGVLVEKDPTNRGRLIVRLPRFSL